MTTYFVHPGVGSDGNAGTSAGSAFATVGKVIAASGVGANGDVVYIAPSTVVREAVTVGISPTAEIQIIGDVLKSQAWPSTVLPGPVRWTSWTTSDFVTTGSTSPALQATTKNFLTLVDLWMQSATSQGSVALISGCHDWTFRRCLFQTHHTSSTSPFQYTGTAGTSANLTLDTCLFMGGSGAGSFVLITMPTHASDYDANITITNCLFGGTARVTQLNLATSGGSGGKPRVVTITNCTICASDSGITVSSSYKVDGSVKIYGCHFGVTSSFAIDGGTSGIVTEDFNHFTPSSGTGRTALVVGVNSDSSAVVPVQMEFGQSALWGLAPHPFMTPLPPAALQLGYGSDGTVTTATDLLRRPRPAGGGSSALTANVSGTATAGAGSTLTDGGASWTTNEHRGKLIKLTGGTGSGQNRRVASNTGTVVTTDRAWSTNPDNTSAYSIVHAGAEKAVGAYELHDNPILGAAANADGGAGGVLTFVGPGDQDLQIPVDATSTTITVKVKWDSGHGDTNKPRAILLAAPELGLAASEDATLGWRESKTATGTAGSAYETLTFTAVTPSAKGILYLRLQSRSATGAGLCHFDTVT